MSERRSAGELLARAAAIFDAPGNSLAPAAAGAWRRGFASGGEWMAVALQAIRHEHSSRSSSGLQWLGIKKYAMASAAALLFVLAAAAIHQPLIGLAGVVAFYAVEAQMVFLFPLALDGRADERGIFRESRRLTLRAGGTLAVMRTVLPLAAAMICGGFLGRGFVRSWCLGCLAVCIWYEDLRRDAQGGDDQSAEATPGAALAKPTRHTFLNRSPFQFGAFGPLYIRRERVEIGVARPARLLYVSDLHLGWWWTNPVVSQLLAAAESCAPDAIILGGDLADRRSALASLGDAVAELAKFAPVYALAGNHDLRIGAERVRAAVQAGGATWMSGAAGKPSVQLRPDLLLGATLDTPEISGHRIYCGHDPAVFPAACRAGYRLILAGHLHGGQCVLATRRGRLHPGCWFARWTGLRFTDGRSTMLVSRGAADTLPLRWNCPREVVVCDLI